MTENDQRRLSVADPANPSAALEAALFEIKRVIVGQEGMLERVLVALLSGGHLLLEGVPGLAKTRTIATLAQVLGGSVPTHPVHPRPGPLRSGRDPDLAARPGRLRNRTRPGVLQLPAG